MCKLLLKHYDTTLLVSTSSIIFEGLSILRSKRRVTLLTFIYLLCLSACTSVILERHLHKYQVRMRLLCYYYIYYCVSERDKNKCVSCCDSLVDLFFISPL